MKVKEFIAMLRQFDGDRTIGFAIDAETSFDVAQVYPNDDDDDKKALWVDLMPRKATAK